MFKNLSIRSRLILIISTLSVLAGVLITIGLYGINYSNSKIQTIYADRLLPTDQLSKIKAFQYENRLKIFKTFIAPSEREMAVNVIADNLAHDKKLWVEYRATFFTPEEKILADKFEKDKTTYTEQFVVPAQNFLKTENFDGLEKLISDKANLLFVPVEKSLNDLIALQIHVARMEYNDAQATYKAVLTISLILLFFGLSAAVLLGLAIIRNLTRSLNNAKNVATAIAHGDLTSQIVIDGNDEITTLLHSMQTMQNTLVNFVEAQTFMAKKHNEGWISEKMDVEKFHGAYGDIARNVNEMVAGHIAVKMRAVEIIDQYGKGDFSMDMEPLPGEKSKVSNSIINLKTKLLAINNEISSLVKFSEQGDFSKRAKAEDFDFMFKTMLDSLNKLVGTCEEAFTDVLRVSSALADGDLTQTITKDYPGVFSQVKVGVNNTVQTLTSLIAEIKETTSTIAAVSTEIAAGNNDLAHRTEQQASALEETAASMQELTSTVTHNSDNAKQANQLAVGATEIANKGVVVVQDVVSTMENINQSSLRIVDIISVIDDIAFQTNILALNAAVEAARAGDQGKGFAVVATEVRNLAQRAANAAGEIKRLIGDSVERVSGGSKQVEQAGQTMQDIVQAIEGVNKIIAEIANASAEQSAGISQVGQAIGAMDDVTQQNAALVEQVAATAESLETQTQNLAKELAHFKTRPNQQQNVVKSKPVVQTKSAPIPKPKTESVTTFVSGNDDWEEF